jgi:hypothetical protein
MLKRFAILGLIAALAAVAAPIYADTFIQGAVRQIPTGASAPLGATVGCRVYTVGGNGSPGVPTINANTAACLNDRCIRTFNTNALFGGPGFGGYNCNQESSGPYGHPAVEPSNMTYYNLIDAETGAGTPDHIAYYVVQGQSVNANLNQNAGDARAANCAGTVTQNCFTAGDASNSDSTPVGSTRVTGFGSAANTIASIGGLSPVPTPRVTRPGGGGCAAGEVRVTWDDPITPTATLKNGVADPLQGVNLYSNPADCANGPTGNDPGWTLVGQHGATDGGTGVCAPVGPSTWFALTVRVKGPTSAPSSIETGRVGSGGFVGANSQCVGTATASRIVSFAARYAGRGTVNVNWTSGTEGGVQGFYLTRATSPTGPYTRVSDMIGATGDSSHYTFADKIRTNLGRLVYYQLEIVNADGTIERSGSTSVTTPGPKMKKLGGDQ